MDVTRATCWLDEAVVEDLAVGSAVLGTGGGGDPYIGKLIAQEAIAQHGPVPLLPVDALQDDDVVAIVNMSGAPTVLVEKVPNGGELDVVYRRVAEHAGREPVATLSIEIGGVNSTFPIASAARAGLPLLDADGMGRAFPEFQLTSFNVGGVKFGPRFVTDEKGNVLRIEGVDARWIERINRRALVAMGGSVITAIGLTGDEVKRTAIRGSISLAIAIGEAIRHAKTDKRDWRELLLPACNGIALFEGKVVSVDRRTTEGFALGHAVLAGLGGDSGLQARLDFQNEHLIARTGSDGSFSQVLGTTPDLLAVLDTETGNPITTEGLRYGQRATIIGIPTQPVWRTPRGLELAGPRYFGWDIDYVPIEERAARRQTARG